MYRINYEKKAKEQLTKLAKNKKLLARYFEIEDSIKENPYSPSFKFERLKHDKSGRMSKRLTDKDRVYYRVADRDIYIDTVDIIQVIGHYSDS